MKKKPKPLTAREIAWRYTVKVQEREMFLQEAIIHAILADRKQRKQRKKVSRG